MNRIKGSAICPICNHVILKGNTFCINCVTRIQKEMESVETGFCFNCGRLVESYMKFCPECGSCLETQIVRDVSEAMRTPDIYE